MGKKILLLLLICSILSLVLVSGEIMLSQPEAIYNLGDVLEISTTLKPSQQTSGFFELNVECGSDDENFYKEYLTLQAGEQKKVETSFILTRTLLGDMTGTCIISGEFGSDEIESQEFEISDSIDIILNIENISVEAGENIPVKGTAVKDNNEKVDGFLELYVENTNISITRDISNGEFETVFAFPSNAKSGDYTLIVRVYEKFEDEETNEGEEEADLYVKQTPTKVDIILSKQNVNPGEEIDFTALILDQANDEVKGDIGIEIYDSELNTILEKIVESGEENILRFKTNSTPGYWEIEINALGFTALKGFNVEELEKAEFEMANNTLVITNVGNIVYRKPVEVSIDDHIEVKNVEIYVGESLTLLLSAPNGEYNIEVNDGEDELSANNVLLTGGVIGVQELRRKISLIARYPIAWLFLILVLGLFIMVIFKRVTNKEVYSYPSQEKTIDRRAKPAEQPKPKEEKVEIISGNAPEIEHSLVSKGRKEIAGIVSIKINNSDEMKNCKGTLDNLSKIIAENKGAIYRTPGYIMSLFSSVTTKTFENAMLSIKTAQEVDNLFKEHNKKFKQKIDYGISLNSGELIIGKENDKIKFTSIGNSLALSKKISDLAKEEVLMSEAMNKKIMSRVKTDKEDRDGLNVYHINRIVDRDNHKKFISDFLSRQKQQEEKKE